MKDFLGRPLELDDSVIFITPGYRDYTLGRVIKFTAQKVRVAYQRHKNSDSVSDIIQHSSQLIKVDGPELTMFLLKGKG